MKFIEKKKCISGILNMGIFSTLIGLLLLCIFFTITTDKFLSASNITNIILQSSIVGIVAIGGTMIIIDTGIDLSSGSVIALLGLIAANMAKSNMPVFFVVLITIALGMSIGLFNGLSITKLHLPPFIVTLATMSMSRGLALVYSNATTIYDLPDNFNFFGRGKIIGIPFPVILTIILYLVGHFVLSRTVFGHQVYAIGGNKEAAYLAGIKVEKTETIIYVIEGALVAISAIILTGRLGAALPTAAQGLELNAIAAIVIGGTSFSGGRGTMLGTFIGVLIIGVLNNGLNLLNISPFWTQFVQGSVIFIAVLIDITSQGKTKP